MSLQSPPLYCCLSCSKEFINESCQRCLEYNYLSANTTVLNYQSDIKEYISICREVYDDPYKHLHKHLLKGVLFNNKFLICTEEQLLQLLEVY
jgi:hypothetical protein